MRIVASLFTMLIAVLVAAMWIGIIVRFLPDPGQQVRQGIDAARAACRDGRRLTEREERTCQHLQ